MLKILLIPVIMLFQDVPETFTGIEHIRGTDSLKVSVRLSYELFLRDYQQTVFDDLGITELRSFNPFPSDLANNYLNIKINISANRKEVTGKLLNMEEKGGDIMFNLIYRVDRKLRSITVRNAMLTGLTTRAKNLIILKIGNFESSAIFTPVHPEETFLLNE